MIELAEQSPYQHPSQLKPILLLERLGTSSKVGQTYITEASSSLFFLCEEKI